MRVHSAAHPMAYRFANKLWIDYLVVHLSVKQAAFRLLLLSAVPWIVGLLIAADAGRSRAYLGTPAFYVGSAGIFITLVALAYGSVKQYSIFERILACFDETELSRQATIRQALARHSNLFKQLRAVFIIFLVCALFATSGFMSWPDLTSASSFAGTKLPRFDALEKYGWYERDVAAHGMAIVLVFALFISVPLGTSVSVMIRMPRYLWEVSSHRPILPPSLIKTHFAPATSFYSVISILWLVCVMLVGYFVGKNGDFLSLSIVAALFLIGVVNFAIPQLTYVRVTTAAEELILGIITERFLKGDVVRSEHPSVPDSNAESSRNLSEMETLLSLVKHDDWVYPLHQTYVVVGAPLLSLVSWDLVLRTLELKP